MRKTIINAKNTGLAYNNTKPKLTTYHLPTNYYHLLPTCDYLHCTAPRPVAHGIGCRIHTLTNLHLNTLKIYAGALGAWLQSPRCFFNAPVCMMSGF